MKKKNMKKIVLGAAIAGLCASFSIPSIKDANLVTAAVSQSQTVEQTATAEPDNETMLQGFEWGTSSNGKYWDDLSSKASHFASLGITSIWLPPAYKGMGGTGTVGYDPYDLYDLGEFNQMGTTRTKYGTKDQYISAINKFHKYGIAVYADAVMNHKSGADQKDTNVKAYKVSDSNRNTTISSQLTIDTWTKYTFPGRGNTYSSFKWDYTCFDGVDYDAKTGSNAIYRFNGKTWDNACTTEKGNYDFLMASDLDLNSSKVKNELKSWGKWYVNFASLDGFRIDAVKHMDYEFVEEWITSVRKTTGKDLFSVAEYLDGNVYNLKNYISETGGTTSLFDYALYYKLVDVSKSYNKSMASMLSGTLAKEDSEHAVTFVDNHDQQVGRSDQVVMRWFKPQAYTFILTRKEGIPCVFYADYYGSNDGKTKSLKDDLDALLFARKYFAYGDQVTQTANNGTVLAWARKGDTTHKNSGLAAVISTNTSDQTIKINVGKSHAGEKWIDIMGNSTTTVTISSTGYGTFKAVAKKSCVYVNSSAIGSKFGIKKATGLKKVSVTSSTIKFSWNKVSEVTGYRVYKYNSKTKKWDALKNFSSNSGTVTGLPVASGGTYRVRAFVKMGGKYYFGAMSDSIKVCTLPSKVKATITAGSTRARIDWTKPCSNIVGYKIYYKENPNDSYKVIHTMSAQATSKVITGLKSGKTYYFRIRAYRYNGSKASDGIVYGELSDLLKVTVR